VVQAPGVVHINVQDPSSATPDELNRRPPGYERLFNPTAYGTVSVENPKRKIQRKTDTEKV